MNGRDGAHWLPVLLRREGYASAGTITPQPGESPIDLWARVAEGAGLDSRKLAEIIASAFRTRVADLESTDAQALKLLPEKLARRFHVFPLREDYRHLVVATADPTDLDAEQAIGFASGRTPTFEIATPAELAEAIDARYSPERAVASLLEAVHSQLGAGQVEVVEDETDPEYIQVSEAVAGPVVELANLVLQEAVSRGASDVHIQPTAAGGVVRYRVDGVLRTGMRMPLPVLSRVVSRIKIIGKLDITDRLRPQDGKARITVRGKTYDLRISTVPTRGTEKAVIRILDPQGAQGLADTGYFEEDLVQVRELLRHREGVVIVTGPTGSGKTTTLYAALKEIATEDLNIMTVEDPVEYELEGLTQIQVEPKQGVTFASALRAILRQDPDVIFVGEIRDDETAKMASQAALTGHLVLSTLHTNDALGAIRRLADLGLDLATVVDTVRGAVAQRLVRRLCEHCAEATGRELGDQEAELAERYGIDPPRRAVGCIHCGNSGYRGRLPVAEIAVMTPQLEEAILEGKSPGQLESTARQGGMRSLLHSGLERVRRGETTLEEIERVLGDGEEVAEVSRGAATGSAAAATGSAPIPTATPGEDDPAHILLVDDDGANRTIARAVLEKAGYRVSEAADGVDALKLLELGQEFDLYVLDLQMPRMDGRELLGKLRADMATAGAPVVILTGSGSESTEVEVMEQGADDYIRKPLEPARFVTRVKAVLRRAGG